MTAPTTPACHAWLPTAPSHWRALPKVSLHEHLDGSLRPSTLLALCDQRGLVLPHREAGALAAWMVANADSGSLARYLHGFELTVAAMASAEACERVAYEVACDAAGEGCVLAEFRMAPQLLEPHGLSADEATEAMLAGLARSGLACGLIICGMRDQSPLATLAAAQLALRWRDRGVIGFDLAGPERGHPPGQHEAALAAAQRADLPITCHAGEADEAWRILEAAHMGARRIGHGVALLRQPADVAARQVDEARRLNLHFEVCPTSNVHTQAAASLATHPVREMLMAGLSLSFSTDNRLVSGTSLCQELHAMHAEAGIPLACLVASQAEGMRASFLPVSARQAALAELATWQATPVGDGPAAIATAVPV